MNEPTYDNIFTMYYRLYRAEATIPSTSDDEYTIGISLANEAIQKWANYDGTYWKELFTTAQTTTATEGETTIVTGTSSYLAPEDMRESGGFVKLKNSDGQTVKSIPIIDPQEAQFKTDESSYCYFTGNSGSGYTLNINPAPGSTDAGLLIDYIYYKKPTELEEGDDVTECPNAIYIVHRMLANRFRASRNPYYSSALDDAENALRIMQLDNNSGNWANPWKLPDNSGSIWGQSNQGVF